MIKKFEMDKKYKCIKAVPQESIYVGDFITVGETYECVFLYYHGNNDPELSSSTGTTVRFKDMEHRDSIFEYFVDADKADLIFTAETLKVGDKLMAVKPSSRTADFFHSWKTIKNNVYEVCTVGDRILELRGQWEMCENNRIDCGTEEFYMDQMNLDIEAGCWGLAVEEPGITKDTVNQIIEKIDEIEALLGE